MRILGIETSCDETAAAIVEEGRFILSNVVASQVDIHARYGGVVPEVASRQHLLQIIPVVKKALEDAGKTCREMDGVAVTKGPGLAGSLLVGVNVAKTIALAYNLPLVGVNHLEGHIYANWLRSGESPQDDPPLPLVCLVASGGHTDLVLMQGHGEHIALGRTLDDAAGEAFDKVARVLGLGFPGGPAVQRSAQGGRPVHPLPRAWLRNTDDFSFSGLKTAVLHLARRLGIEGGAGGAEGAVADVAASFQEAVVDVLVAKTLDAAQRHSTNCILLGGGVASNTLLRKTFVERSSIPVRWPPPALCTDNAAMIASCGHFLLERGKVMGWDLDVEPTFKGWQPWDSHRI